MPPGLEMTRADDQPRLFQLDSFAYNEEDDFLGSGAFGSVFRCRLTTTGEIVALKKLYTPQRLKQRCVLRFRRSKYVCLYNVMLRLLVYQ